MSLPVFLLLVSPNSHLTCLHLPFPVLTPSPNEDSLKFIPGAFVMEMGSVKFLDTRTALTSPLALRLFGMKASRPCSTDSTLPR
ncbi:hypothetical protein EI94DRAFT_1030360 [Lactarius quietus]|nr:hypothetical protein EI94DRAFT_1030360 [Lactarius quietus]